MLTERQLAALTERVVSVYRAYQSRVKVDIARRLVRLARVQSPGEWQAVQFNQAREAANTALDELAATNAESELALGAAMSQAARLSLAADSRLAGGETRALSPLMMTMLVEGTNRTSSLLRGVMSGAPTGAQELFMNAAAEMRFIGGEFNYDLALRRAIQYAADNGLELTINGMPRQLDAATQLVVQGGITGTTGRLQTASLDELGIDLVEVSAHIGARNKGGEPENHEMWQGKIYSRSGAEPYPNFVEHTGYGSGEGLLGWNCRHSFWPYVEGQTPRYTQAELDGFAAETVEFEGKEISYYDATQKQRAIERRIRHWKSRRDLLGTAGLDNSAEIVKVREWQEIARRFSEQTGLGRQRGREMTFLTPWTRDFNSQVGVSNFELARTGKLFSILPSEESIVFDTPIDLSSYYPGQQIRADKIIFTPKQKAYIYHGHKDDLIWLSNHQELLLNAISQPHYLDRVPRPAGKNILNIAHVIPVADDDSQFLNIVISFHQKKQETAQVWNLFRASREYLFWEDGVLKPRWMNVK